MEGIKLILGDCLEKMQNIPDKSIDMILCDLPYGTTQCKWDNMIPFDKLWHQYDRIVKDNAAICLFGIEPFSSNLRLSNISKYRYDLIFHKSHPTGFASCRKRFMRYHENMSIFYKKQPVYNPQMRIGKRNHWNKSGSGSANGTQPQMKSVENKNDNMKFPNSVLYFNSPNRNGVFHPTQKPVELLEYLIKTFTNEGMLVLDNTMGSGSTGVACVNTNRKFIGIELDKEYFKLSVKRINESIKISRNNLQGISANK